MSGIMNDGYIGIADAVRRASGNPDAKWPSRAAPNRLEPDCWPTIRPRFKIAPGAKIFTMGSCLCAQHRESLRQHGVSSRRGGRSTERP